MKSRISMLVTTVFTSFLLQAEELWAMIVVGGSSISSDHRRFFPIARNPGETNKKYHITIQAWTSVLAKVL